MADAKRYEITVVPKVDAIVADQSDPDEEPVRVRLHDHASPTPARVAAQLVSAGTGSSPTRDQRVQEVKGVGVVGQQPVLKPGESFEYTSGASIPTAGRHDARHATRWSPRTAARSTRRSRRSRCRCRARCTEPRAAPALAARQRLRSVARRVRSRRIVLALAPRARRSSSTTMATERQRDQGLEIDPFHRALRLRSRRLAIACARAIAAGLARRAAPPTPRARAARAAAGAAARRLHAASRGARCRAGATTASQQAWPALRVGCARLSRSRARAQTWQRAVRRRRRRSTPRDDARCARFFETHFTPYAVAFRRRPRRRTRHRLLRAAARGLARATAAFRVAALRACPTTCSIVDLASLYPELKDKRVRGRVDGRRVVPYWPRADIERGAAPLDGKVLAYVDDPRRRVLPADPGLGARRARPTAASMRVGYADQNGHPYRSIARVLIERGELTLERASMQAIRAWGRANPDKLARAARRESELRVLSARCRAPAPGTLEAAIDGPIGSLGVPLLRRAHDRRRPARDPARRAGVPRDDRAAVDDAAATAGARAGHRRRDPRRRARRFLLGLRRRCGRAGGPDAAGRTDVAAVAEGRAAARCCAALELPRAASTICDCW